MKNCFLRFLLFILMGGAAGCAHLDTPSGRPEIFFHDVHKTAAMGTCIRMLKANKFQIETVTNDEVTGLYRPGPWDTWIHSMWGCQYRISFKFVEAEAGVRIFAQAQIVADTGKDTTLEKTTPLTDHRSNQITQQWLEHLRYDYFYFEAQDQRRVRNSSHLIQSELR